MFWRFAGGLEGEHGGQVNPHSIGPLLSRGRGEGQLAGESLVSVPLARKVRQLTSLSVSRYFGSGGAATTLGTVWSS